MEEIKIELKDGKKEEFMKKMNEAGALNRFLRLTELNIQNARKAMRNNEEGFRRIVSSTNKLLKEHLTEESLEKMLDNLSTNLLNDSAFTQALMGHLSSIRKQVEES